MFNTYHFYVLSSLGFYLSYQLCLYSVYFLALPLTKSFGYFFPFFYIFLPKEALRSIPHTSENLIK